MDKQKYAMLQAKSSLIQDQIDALNRKAEGRKPTREERKFVDECEDAQAAIEEELHAMAEDARGTTARPETMPGNGTIRQNTTGGFASFGAQMAAVAQAGIPGGQIDPRLFNAATGLSETVPSEGGFLVQQDFTNKLFLEIFGEAVLAGRCNRLLISSGANSISVPAPDESSRATGSRWGGVQGSWVVEAGEITGSKPKFRNMELKLKKVAALVYATDELLADAAALETYITQASSAELAFLLDAAIFNGTGAGQPLGLLNSGSLVTVDKEDGQAASTIVLENIVNMFARMPARNRKTAAWYINQSIEPQLFQMSLAVGTGGHGVFFPAGGVSEAPYASLLGRPVIPIEQASPLGGAGDIVFADMGSYLLAEKGGVQSDVSIHVRFNFDESVFRFVLRIDGQPSWAAPLEPYGGGDSLSPFVTLEARS